MSLEISNLGKEAVVYNYESARHPEQILPLDIWKFILSYIDPRINGTSFSNFGAVCKTFHQFCINSIKYPIYFEHLVFSKIDTLGAVNIKQISSIKTKGENLHFLSEADGSYYFRSTGDKYCLYIFQANTSSFISLNLVNQIKPHVSEKIKPQVDFYSQEILNCFPLDTGFVVITTAGVSVWAYVENQLVFQAYYTPFEYSGCDTEIYGAGLIKNVLFLKVKDGTNGYHDFFYTLDLNKIDPNFEIYPSMFKGYSTLFPLGKRLLHKSIYHEGNFTELEVIEGEKKDDELSFYEAFCNHYKNFTPAIGNDSWLVAESISYDNGLQFNWISAQEKNLEKWQHIDCELHIRRLETPNLFLRDHYLFAQTPLPTPKTQLISLSTKEEFGPKLTQFLTNINLTKSVIGMWAFLKENKKVLRILAQDRKTSELQLLEMELCKKSEMPSPPVPQVIEQPTLDLPQRITAAPPTSKDSQWTIEKVVMLAGAILLWCAIASFIAGRYHPSVFKGFGTILTASLGITSVALLVIGGGIYYKKRKALT